MLSFFFISIRLLLCRNQLLNLEEWQELIYFSSFQIIFRLHPSTFFIHLLLLLMFSIISYRRFFMELS